MSDAYFSERELGGKPRLNAEINRNVWGAIVAIIRQLIENGSFANSFPERCEDGNVVICGTDRQLIFLLASADIPEISWPLEVDEVPSTVYVMDIIEFCFKNVARPIQVNFHSYYGHYHLSFDIQEG